MNGVAAVQRAITPRDLVAYLLKHRLIGPSSIVGGRLTVTDASSRNQCYQVHRQGGPSYFVKQAIGRERVETVAREAALYRVFASHPGAREIRRYVPRFRRYDAATHLLVTEMVPRSVTLTDYHVRGRFSTALARVAAESLAALHQFGLRTRLAERSRAEEAPPWALGIHKPGPDTLWRSSAASVRLVGIMQGHPDFCDALDRLRAAWPRRTVIHGDVKWDNYVVCPRDASRGAVRLKLIDWELASVGDPSWDTGSVMANYLVFWLLSMPLTGDAQPERLLDGARYALPRMQPALRVFWATYVRRSGMAPAAADGQLRDSMRYAAARLVQTAYEKTQHAADISTNMLGVLQLAINIMQRPEEAAAHLLGLTFESLAAS